MKKIGILLLKLALVLAPHTIAGQETLFSYSLKYPPYEAFVDEFSDNYIELARQNLFNGNLDGIESCIQVQRDLNIFHNAIYCGKIENQKGIIEYYKNNSNNALEHYLKALDYFNKGKSEDGINLIMNNIAIIFEHINDYESTRKYLIKALEYTPEKDIDGRSIYMLNLAGVESRLGNCIAGIQIANDLLELYDPNNVSFSEVAIFGVLIGCYDKMELYDEAQSWIDKGSESIDNNTNYLDLLAFYSEVIKHYYLKNDYGRVIELGRNIYPPPDTSFTRDMYESINYMAIAALEMGDINFAIELDRIANRIDYSKETLNREDLITPLMVEYSYTRDAANNDLARIQLSENSQREKVQRRLLLSLIFIILVMIVLSAILNRIRRLKNKYKLELSNKNDKLEKITHQLIAENEELDKGNRLLDTLISVFAHDLINPFQAILGFSQLMIDDHEILKDEDFIEYSGLLSDTSFQLGQLLTNLRSLSITQGQAKLQISKVDVEKIIKDVLIIFEPSARKKGIKFSLNPGDNCYGLINGDIIESVIRNVISNAVKFSKHDGKIVIMCHRDRSEIIISIKDHGIGMPERVQKNLRYQSQPESRVGTANEKGSGIGLAISIELLESYNGCLTITSKENEGTEVNIKIPGWNE